MKKIIIIVVALLVLGGGGAAAFFMLGEEEPAVGADGEAVVAPVEEEKDPIYLGLDPAFVANYEVNGTVRYLQVNLQMMSYDQGVVDKVSANIPAVRNRLIMLLSSQDYNALASVEGKEDLREQVLVSINEAVKLEGDTKVDDVFFTGFVMQ